MAEVKEKNKDINSLTFEQAMAELEQLVRSLESGQTNLEDSVQAYERGIALKNHCEDKLKQAKLRVDKITLIKDDKGQEAVELSEFETG